MAILANTYKTYESKGNREQLADVIYRITPEETPLLSAVPRGSVKGTLNEWQTDSLAAPAANAVVEGDDVTTFDAVTPTVRIANYQQISRKAIIISDTEEEIDKAGRDSELNYQTAMKSVELKRDMETVMFATNQAGVAGAAAVARLTASLLNWIRTNTSIGAGGANAAAPNPFPAGTRTDGTQRPFTEALLKTVIQAMWASGANIQRTKLYVNGAQKQVVSGFTGIATRNFNMASAKGAAIIAAADVYVSDFGTVEIVPSRLQRNRDAWLLDSQFLQVDYLRPFRRVPLAKTGDATKRMLLTEYGLRVKNEAALGAVFDLS